MGISGRDGILRETIRRLLIDNIEAVRELDGAETDYTESRVREPQGVLTTEKRPFIVIEFLSPDPTEAWAEMTQNVGVWPNVPVGDFPALDALAEQVIDVLGGRRFATGEGADTRQFYAEHAGGGGDAIEDTFGGITKLLRFTVYELGWLSFETFDPDPIKALKAWSEERFPDQLQTDPATWDPSDAKPGLYWRLRAIPNVLEHFPTWSRVEVQIFGHILAPSYRTRLEWTRRVHQELVRTRRVKMTEPDPADPGQELESPLFIERAGADSSANPFTVGQIVIVASYGILVNKPLAPKLDHVHVGGDVPEQEVQV